MKNTRRYIRDLFRRSTINKTKISKTFYFCISVITFTSYIIMGTAQKSHIMSLFQLLMAFLTCISLDGIMIQLEHNFVLKTLIRACKIHNLSMNNTREEKIKLTFRKLTISIFENNFEVFGIILATFFTAISNNRSFIRINNHIRLISQTNLLSSKIMFYIIIGIMIISILLNCFKIFTQCQSMINEFKSTYHIYETPRSITQAILQNKNRINNIHQQFDALKNT